MVAIEGREREEMSGDGAKTSKMATQMSFQMTPPRKQEERHAGKKTIWTNPVLKQNNKTAQQKRESGSLYCLCAQNWLSSEKS